MHIRWRFANLCLVKLPIAISVVMNAVSRKTKKKRIRTETMSDEEADFNRPPKKLRRGKVVEVRKGALDQARKLLGRGKR